ncbi:hypothetical protein OIU84_022311 [Salix udensis]|uniref:Uncharacterized protein n=1 Tax=Salix udensis TaxID=889485 RepID=A0AAD6KN92_9ROSI|nr:hypothetical protein OIU84_022311 [Salix udensis]
MELCALVQQIPFHQKLRQHLMMKQQLEILYIMPMLGNANGTAGGMTPLAHLAICNVCSDFGCLDSDIMAAMDAAVEDGMVQSAFLKIQWQWELFERLVQEFSWFVQQGMKDHIMVLYQMRPHGFSLLEQAPLMEAQEQMCCGIFQAFFWRIPLPAKFTSMYESCLHRL